MKENNGFIIGKHEKGSFKWAPHVPGVYMIWHDKTKRYYIGKSTNVGRRISHHFGQLNRGAHHCNALQDFYIKNNCSPDDFSFTYIRIEDAQLREETEEYILGLRMSEMFNTTLDKKTWIEGKTSKEVAEWKKKISQSRQGRFTADDNHFYGKKHSKETKRKISEKQIGKENPSCHKPVCINGVYYKSLTQASIKLGVSAPTLLNRIRSEKRVFCNYFYIGDESDVKIIDRNLIFDPKRKDIKKAFQIDNEIFYSTKDISDKYGIKRNTVSFRIKSDNPKFLEWKEY